MKNKIQKIFFDGSIVPSSKKLLDTITPGKIHGRGVFETMRAYEGNIFLLDKHLDRLFLGLKELSLDAFMSRRQIKKEIDNLLCINKLKNARIRLSLWKEKGKLRVDIVAFPYKPPLKSCYRKGFAVVVSNKNNKKTNPSCVKSVDYGFFLGAYNKAISQGYDEAIILNKNKEVAEGSRTNIFLVKGKSLCTPALSCGCLNGITRQKVLEIAKKLRIKTKAGVFQPKDLEECEEMFLTNSLLEIMPVNSVNGHPINNGKTGKITQKLLNAYRKQTQSIK